MKVLMIEPIGYSGICIYTAQLCGGLIQAGCKVSLVTSRLYDPKTMNPHYPYHAILGGCDRERSRVTRALNYLVSWIKLPGILSKDRPDVIHIQNSFVPALDLIVIGLLRLAGFPIIYTVHDVDRSGMMTSQRLRIFMNRFIDKRVYQAVNSLIVHTRGSSEELQALYAIPSKKIIRINHGNQAFHLDGVVVPSRSDARVKLLLPRDAFIILFFGDRRPSKGLDLLIKALGLARVSAPDIHLVIAGERRVLDTNDYVGMARTAGIEDVCHFHDGFISTDQVPVFFAASDVVALPYRKIYQSGVVHLAFAFGKPVVSSRAGGLSETVEEGKTGFFVNDPEDIPSLASVLLKSYSERNSLGQMGDAAREVEMKEYGWDGIGKETMHLYELMRNRK